MNFNNITTTSGIGQRPTSNANYIGIVYSNVLNSSLSNYLPLIGGVLSGNLDIGNSISTLNVNSFINVSSNINANSNIITSNINSTNINNSGLLTTSSLTQTSTNQVNFKGLISTESNISFISNIDSLSPPLANNLLMGGSGSRIIFRAANNNLTYPDAIGLNTDILWMSSSNIFFYINGINTFNINSNGALITSNLDVNGTINATSITINGINITSNITDLNSNTSNYIKNVSNILLENINTNTYTSNYIRNASNIIIENSSNFTLGTALNTSNYIRNVSKNLNIIILEQYTPDREYPPKQYNTSSSEVETSDELCNISPIPFYKQIITLDTTDISYGSGDYVIYSSSIYPPGTTNETRGLDQKKNLFDYNLSDIDRLFNGNYYNSEYSSEQPSYINSGYNGDWIIVKLPNPIILTGFRFYAQPSQVDFSPGLWKCYGSNDGITFIEISEASNTVTSLVAADYINDGFISMYEKRFPTFNTFYKYIGFTIKQVILTYYSGILMFTELRLLGKELKIFYSDWNSTIKNKPDLIIYATSNYITNVSNIIIENSSNFTLGTSLNTSNYTTNISNIIIENSSNFTLGTSLNTSNYAINFTLETALNTSNYSTNISNIIIENSSNFTLGTSLNTSNYARNISDILNSEIDQIYTPFREYPPKLYTSASDETTESFPEGEVSSGVVPDTYYKQTLTLDYTNISYGSGEYIIYSSSFNNISVNSENKKNSLFNYNTTISVVNPVVYYKQFGNNYKDDGYYQGYASYLEYGYNGDWIIIKLPYPITLLGFKFYANNLDLSTSPALWKCYGSKDGKNFIEISEASNTIRPLVIESYIDPNSTDGVNERMYWHNIRPLNTVYKYIGFVINKIIGANNHLSLAELRLLGKEVDLQSLTTVFNNLIINTPNKLILKSLEKKPPVPGITGDSGDRIILCNDGGGVYPYAIGIHATNIWFVVPTPVNNTSPCYKWYSGQNTIMSLTSKGELTVIDDIVAFGSLSDKRLKTNINNLSINCINLLNKIKSVEFNWIDHYRIPEKKRHTLDHGFIAQDIEEILPNLVNSEGEYKSLKYEKFAPYLVKAIQELNIIIKDQQEQINYIKSHLNL